MKEIAGKIAQMSNEDIIQFEKDENFDLDLNGNTISLNLGDVEIISEDIPGWLVINDGNLTVALDINVTSDLKYEGIARELVNRIQNLRKESGFDVTDKIEIEIQNHESVNHAVEKHKSYIGAQTLANSITLTSEIHDGKEMELDENISIKVQIKKSE